VDLVRGIENKLQDAWAANPIVVVEGPRAVGKTTLAKSIVDAGRWFALDDDALFQQAKQSPRAWLESLPSGSAIDEAQRIEGISLEAKRIVDHRQGQAGQFLLTGSARLSRDELGGSDPLVGRARRLQLLPFSQNELAGRPSDVLSALFDIPVNDFVGEAMSHRDLLHRISRGGFPALNLASTIEPDDWLRDYVADTFRGDLYETGRNAEGIKRLFWHLAANSGVEVNLSKFGAALELNKETVSGYLGALQAVHLIAKVESFSQQNKRAIKRSRLFVVDPAFAYAASHPIGDFIDAQHGALVETFVTCELQRLATWSERRVTFSHWRDKLSTDLTIEDEQSGRVIAIEIKSNRETSADQTAGIRAFKEAHPGRFHRGFVLYTGDQVVRFGEDIFAVPISALWTIGKTSSARLTPGQQALQAARKTLSGAVDSPDHILGLVDQNVAQAQLFLYEINEHLEALGINLTVSVDPESAFATQVALRLPNLSPLVTIVISAATPNRSWIAQLHIPGNEFPVVISKDPQSLEQLDDWYDELRNAIAIDLPRIFASLRTK
jgi:uncharacterized protein